MHSKMTLVWTYLQQGRKISPLRVGQIERIGRSSSALIVMPRPLRECMEDMHKLVVDGLEVIFCFLLVYCHFYERYTGFSFQSLERSRDLEITVARGLMDY